MARTTKSLDWYINKFVSRKLFIVIGATILLCTGVIDPVLWSGIAAFYIGAESFIDHKALTTLPPSED